MPDIKPNPFTHYKRRGTSVSFPDNKNNYAPKLNAEAGRPDGFTVLGLGYDSTPPQSAATIAQDYVENMKVQGWALYRTDPALNSAFQTNATLWLATNADTQMPQWDSTAAQSSAAPAPRIGVQEVVAGDQSVTVRWDVARDQTGPIRYNVYYTSQPALNFATATKLTNVVTAMPTNYATGTGAGIYPYEYTVTGLSNGVTYTFGVRAEDSANPSHEDTNTVTLSVVTGNNVPTGTYRSITIDGTFSDWVEVPWAYHGGSNGNPVNYSEVQFANDGSYLYGHFKLHAAAAPFSDFNTHLFVDRDDNVVTGFHPTGGSFGSEMMIEGATGYDQRNGGFNEGTVAGTTWLLAPGGSGPEFEFRLSLAAAYAGAVPVFASNQFRLLLQDSRGNEVSGSTGIAYALAAAPPPTYAHLTVDGNTTDWAGVPWLAVAPATNTALGFGNLYVANDNYYLYLRFTLQATGTPFSDFNTHAFIDTDNNGTTGYHPSGLTMGAELMIESGTGYDERSGVFNGGTVSGLNWLLSPSGAGTNFEARLSRQAQYAGGAAVFTNSTIRLILQDNRGSALIPQGVSYTFADGGPYENWRAQYFTAAELANPTLSGDGASASGDGVPNLVKYAFDLPPRVVNLPPLPSGFIDREGGTNYFHFQFVQRNPPAGVQYLPQVSPDLTIWDSAATNFATRSVTASTNNTSLVTMRLQTPKDSAPQRFVRIAIQK